MENADSEYVAWLKLRNDSMDEFGDMLCYCGHTDRCSCADPDVKTFAESVANGAVKPGDPYNGWKSISHD